MAWKMNTLVSLAAFSSLLFKTVHASPFNNDTSPSKPGEGWDFTWDSITPSPKLVYSRCYDTFECARLQVPLDWLSTNSSGPNASIAIIKYPSDPTSYPEYGKKWGGPVLINPGGPGGSGVQIVLSTGPHLQAIVGKQYSIIGFDPRGVNNTVPLASCFDSEFDRILWEIKGRGRIGGSADEEELGETIARAKILGKMCTTGERAENAKYFGTASVARDMLAITEASWDLAKSGVRKSLQYWGFSYGTVLGMTYATLFPDKIDRMVLDGVVDIFDYSTITGEKNLIDTEAVMDSFYEYCAQAGPLKCDFHTGTTPNDIRNRHYALLGALRTMPLAYNILAPDNSTSKTQPDVFTYDDLRYLTFSALYFPVEAFPILAKGMALLEESLPEGSLSMTAETPGRKYLLTCSAKANEYANTITMTPEAQFAVMCGDGPSFANFTLAMYKEKLRKLEAQSPTAGAIFVANFMSCIGWKAQAKWKATFSMVNNNSKKRKGGAPILLIGTTGDAVTPLVNAYSMAKQFPKGGAYVAVQEGEGHCSISVPSYCMVRIINTYFAKGTVPETEEDRYCAQEIWPFMGEATGGNSTKRDSGRIEAREAMKSVGRVVTRQLANNGPLAKSRFGDLFGF